MNAHRTGLADSPRRFLHHLRETAQCFHQLFAKRMAEVGFEVRAVIRKPNHAHVWALRLRRGNVPPGQEIATVKRAVSSTLRSLGFRCPPKEVEALVKGDRVEPSFICRLGTPGSLWFHKGGREEWIPEAPEPCSEPLEQDPWPDE